VVACIHPIGIHSAQILDLELDQRASKLCRVSKLLCEFISLELVASAENVHQQFDNCIHWCKSIREEDKADYYGELIVKPKGLVKRLIVNENGEEGKNVEEVGLVLVSTEAFIPCILSIPVRYQKAWLYAQGSSGLVREQGQRQLPASHFSQLKCRK
jgi:hypothetical protein